MAHARQPRAYTDLYRASRCIRGLNGEPCGGVPYDVEATGRRNCPICMRVKFAWDQWLLHDRALEQAVYALDPTLPDLPEDTHWRPRLPTHVLPLPPAPPPVHVAKVKAYLGTEQGQVRQGASGPTGAPMHASRTGPLHPPPLPPGAAGVRPTVVVFSIPISPAGGSYAPACRVVEPSPPPPPAT